MTTIHLTDAQRDTFAASGLIVIDGEPCWCADMMPKDFFGTPEHEHERPAPEGWRILTEPCDTCRTFGTNVKMCLNPDCVGGRRVVTLTATCPKCGGGYCTEHLMCRQDAEAIERMHFCGACHGSGVVTLGRFTIPPLLPVVSYDDWQIDGEPTPSVTIDSYGQLVHMVEHDDPGTTYGVPLPTPDPLPRPGQFIARPERVA